jgi:hypothetical protein
MNQEEHIKHLKRGMDMVFNSIVALAGTQVPKVVHTHNQFGGMIDCKGCQKERAVAKCEGCNEVLEESLITIIGDKKICDMCKEHYQD